MPRSRGSEMPLRQQSPKLPIRAPSKTTSSDSDPSHLRPTRERTSRLVDRRSPAKSEPVNQKKLGTRIADLESQLGTAQTELKILKDQLSSAQEAKRVAHDKLEKKVEKSENIVHNKKQESQPETDVFEVMIETVQNKVIDDELGVKSDEISLLKARLEEKVSELERIQNENNAMKGKLDEMNSEMVTVKGRETESTLRLEQLEKELDESKEDGNRIKEKIEAMEASKEGIEAEMKKMRVQTEQWRKAADAAAAMLSGGVMETNGRRRISERCGSMEGQYRGGMGDDDDDDDLEENGKRKGSSSSSGIRMFGDLWRKKVQK